MPHFPSFLHVSLLPDLSPSDSSTVLFQLAFCEYLEKIL